MLVLRCEWPGELAEGGAHRWGKMARTEAACQQHEDGQRDLRLQLQAKARSSAVLPPGKSFSTRSTPGLGILVGGGTCLVGWDEW